MNLPIYISRRYLFAKKSHNAINIITLISVIVVAVGTTALVLILSVFNGLNTLITSLYGTFDPDLKISSLSGKYIQIDEFPFEKIQKQKGIVAYSTVLEDMALIKYDGIGNGENGRQFLATIKGVSPEFSKICRIDTMMIDGYFMLQQGNRDFAVLGNGVAGRLQIHLNDFENPLNVYYPRGNALTALNPLEAFSIENIFPSGVFSIQQEYDDNIVLTSLRYAQRLMNRNSEITSIEIAVKDKDDLLEIQEALQNEIGKEFVVKNRYQQNEMIYKIMKSEKWSSFMILGFILLIAIFNVVGSVTVLIIEKKKDINSLKNMGASDSLIRRIFFFEGMMISFLGAIIGLSIGAILCFIQIYFGVVPMEGNFAVNIFPVKMQISDFISVLALILGIGFFATIVPVRRISKKYLG